MSGPVTFKVELHLVKQDDGIWVHWIDHGTHEKMRHGPYPSYAMAQEVMRMIVDCYRDEPGSKVEVTGVGFAD